MNRVRGVGFAVVMITVGVGVFSGGCRDTAATEATSLPQRESVSRSLCTPNTQQCPSTKLAQVCASDGSRWVTAPCLAGQTCENGVCGKDGGAPGCRPGIQECMSGALARVCPADGSGWVEVKCGTGQTCANGACAIETDAAWTPGVGVAVRLGVAQCASLLAISTSTDGVTFTTTPCPAGELCVTTGAASALCTSGSCTPDLSGDGCDETCGNKADLSRDQTRAVSTCVATAAGYEWAIRECPVSTTCKPNGALCGTAAAPTCSPG